MSDEKIYVQQDEAQWSSGSYQRDKCTRRGSSGSSHKELDANVIKCPQRR